MIAPSDVSACLVTRGDVDLDEIVESLAPFAEVIVWDNGVQEDFAVYGRYKAIERASSPVVYVQDDDCIIDPAAVCARYEPGTLVANMPVGRWRDYPDSALVGWGAVFDRHLPDQAFRRWSEHVFSISDETWLAGLDYPWWNRICDLVFSTITSRHRKIDVGFRHLPWAEGPGRMFTADPAAHRAEHERALRLAREVRDA